MTKGKVVEGGFEFFDKKPAPPPRQFLMNKPQEDELRKLALVLVRGSKLSGITEAEAALTNLSEMISTEEVEAEFNVLLEKVSRIFAGGDIADEYMVKEDVYRIAVLEVADTFDIYRRTIVGEGEA